MTNLKTHVSINVTNLTKSIDFYQKLFGVDASFVAKDYAKFDLDDPALVLSLEPIYHRASDAFNHLGIRLASAEAVGASRERLAASGASVDTPEDVECCYSTQTKFWIADPDKNLWEIYALTGALPRRGSLTVSDALAARDRDGSERILEHKLGDSFPDFDTIPHGSVDEVRLRGSFNAPMTSEARVRVLTGARTVLAAGGRVLVHGLVADSPVLGEFPMLPGPAALVSHAPVLSEVVRWLEDAGFVGVYSQKLGEHSNFAYAGVKMRELMLVGWSPPPATGASAVDVIYRGPFRSVELDGGLVLRRGERVSVDPAVAESLRRGPSADQIAFMTD